MTTKYAYTIEALLFQNDLLQVYSGIRNQDKMKVLIKLPIEKMVSSNTQNYLINESNVYTHLKGSYFLKWLDCTEIDNQTALIFEQTNAKPLTTYLNEHKTLELTHFFKLALIIANAIEDMHALGVIHKNLNPDTILYDGEELKIVDFSIASMLREEKFSVHNPMELNIEGQLFYIAPEQTGRINKKIDYRSDYYAFGVILYQILTQTVPFKGKEPSTIIYAHIAKLPQSPSNINPDIPEMVSEIILKLLAKNAHDRYQTMSGFKEDIMHCQQEYEQNNKIPPFQLGMHDLSPELQIPEIIYGRETDIQELVEEFKHCTDSQPKLILISGYSGIGKTSLLREACKYITNLSYYFCTGKFNQLQKNIPYMAINIAIEQLVYQLLTEKTEQLQAWQKKFSKTFSEQDAFVLSESIPSLRCFLTDTGEKEYLTPVERQELFNLNFRKLMQMLARDCPFILFLDDLQWASHASLYLIQYLMHTEIPNFVIVCAYRDNEVDALHPLQLMINDLQKNEIRIKAIHLSPLTIEDTTTLLTDTLHLHKDKLKDLAALCYKKTEGNPFYLIEFLKLLAIEDLLFLDKKSKEWCWEMSGISALEMTENVIDLMSKKIKKLPRESQVLLQFAACISAQFSLEQLLIVSNYSLEELEIFLKPILNAGLILPLDTQYRVVSKQNEHKIMYRFLHDKVQQAAYAGIEALQKAEVHLIIGRLLHQKLSPKEQAQQIFSIVQHLNYGIDLITEDAERQELIGLNLEAGKKSIASNAYDIAEDYLKKAMHLLNNNTEWSLKFEVFYQYSMSLFLLNKFDEVISVTNKLLAETKNPLELAELHFLQMQIAIMRSEYQQAIEVGIKALKVLNFPLQEHPSTFHLVSLVLRTKLKLLGKTNEVLLNQPRIQDLRLNTILKILNTFIIPAIVINPKLFAASMFNILHLTLKYGNSPYAPIGFLVYGISLCGFLDIHPKSEQKGYNYALLAVQLMEKYATPTLHAFYYFFYLFQMHPRRHPYRTCYPLLEKGYVLSEHAGSNLISVAYLYHIVSTRILSGQPLPEVLIQAENAIKSAEKVNDVDVKACISLNRSFCLALMEGGDVWTFNNLTEAGFIQFIEDNKLARTHLLYVHQRGTTDYFLDNYQSALIQQKRALECAAQRHSGPAYIYVSHYFFYPLTLCALYHEWDAKAQKDALKTIKKYLKILKHRMQTNPDNHENKYWLVQAEYERIQKNYDESIKCFKNAVDSAIKAQFIHEEALAHELWAKLYLEINEVIAAKGHFNEAIHLYKLWGAKAKISLLTTKFAHLELKAEEDNEYGNELNIDLEAVIDSLTTISKEIEIEKVISAVLHIIVKNSGAQSGTLLLINNDKLQVAGHLDDRGSIKYLLNTLPYEKVGTILPKTIAEIVLKTKNPITLNTSKDILNFNRDPYFARNPPKSALCFPIIQKDNVKGILYLENQLSEYVFTEERMQILNILGTQVAISTENARLYKIFEHFVPKEFLGFLNKKNLTDVSLGDCKEKEFTILFADVNNFASLSENMPPTEVFYLLNDYYKCIEPEIMQQNGFVDKYLGDALLALFPERAEQAIVSALRVQQAIANLNKLRSNKKTLSLSVGLNTGRSIFGIVGAEHRFDVSIISDATNLAARVQSLTKIYNLPILTTQHTINRCANKALFAYREIDKVRVKGKEEVISLFEIMPSQLEETERKMDLTIEFEKAKDLYAHCKFISATKIFKKCHEKNLADPIYEIYIKRCIDMAKNQIDTKTFNGTWNFKDK